MKEPVLLLKHNYGVTVESDSYPLVNSPVKVGRETTADLRIQDRFISRMQAVLYSENGKWFIRDDQSKNGTFVNDIRIGSGPVPLKNGDTISFCKKIEYVFQSDDPDSDETMIIADDFSRFGIELLEKSEDVIVDGVKLNPRLGPQEWKFLSLLLEDPDRIHTYKELSREIFRIEEDIFAAAPYLKMLQAIKNDISKKLRKQGITRSVIKSRSGVGYQLVEKDAEQ